MNLYSAVSNADGFFTVGGNGIGTADKSNFKWSDSAVESSKKIQGQPLQDMLPDGDIPYGIALITSKGSRNRGTMVPNIATFSKRNPYIYLNNDANLMEELRDHLQDLVVFGKKSKTDGCNVFQVSSYLKRLMCIK